jgi:hypothetical protein
MKMADITAPAVRTRIQSFAPTTAKTDSPSGNRAHLKV